MRAGGTSYLSSPDTASTIFPDRLIRPLPRRTLKSRLSQEAAETIEYPPSLPSTNLPSYTHYGENGEILNESKVMVRNGDLYDEHDHYHDHDHDHCPHHCHHDDEEDELDSADDDIPVALRHTSYRSSPRSPRSARHARYGSQNKGSVSGPDGYEAFENTNNKKKRKIPTSGSLSLHHSSLTSDLAHLGLGGNHDGAGDEYSGQISPSGLGVQGAGRGHYARRGSGRRPLGVSMNGSNLKSTKYDQNMNATAKGTFTLLSSLLLADPLQPKIPKTRESSRRQLPMLPLCSRDPLARVKRMSVYWISKPKTLRQARSSLSPAKPMQRV